MTLPKKQFVTISDIRIAYVESGDGDPIVFLHGNPTSSYLWRGVIPHVEGTGRCLAPDLIGRQRQTPHERSRLLHLPPAPRAPRRLDRRNRGNRAVTLVGHDWGAALAFDWARRHPDAVRAIAYLEAPVAAGRWADFPPQATELFRALRSPAGEQMILEQNMFIEQILPSGVLEPLTEETLAEYRRPFAQAGEGRRTMLSWARQIPIDGEPVEVAEILSNYAAWMTGSRIPKLLIKAEPGQVLTGPALEFCRTWPNQTEVTIAGRHFIQEDAGPEIGNAIATWLHRL